MLLKHFLCYKAEKGSENMKFVAEFSKKRSSTSILVQTPKRWLKVFRFLQLLMRLVVGSHMAVAGKVLVHQKGLSQPIYVFIPQ